MNQQISEAMEALENGDFSKALVLVRPLLNSTDESTRLSANDCYANTNFELKEYAEAARVFEGLASELNDGPYWLSTVVAYVKAKDFEKAEQCFIPALKCLNAYVEKLTVNGVGWQPEVITGNQLYFYFIQAAIEVKAPEIAFFKFKDFAKVYCEIAITDDHFLITRGAVPFQRFCNLLESLYALTSKKPEWEDIFKRLSTELDDNGKKQILDLKNRLVK